MNKHKIAQMYGNAGYKFPRTTEEAFGPGEAIFVATEDDEPEESSSFAEFFALVVYMLAAVVIGFILWGQK